MPYTSTITETPLEQSPDLPILAQHPVFEEPPLCPSAVEVTPSNLLELFLFAGIQNCPL